MTNDEILERAYSARTLLEHEAFLSTISDLEKRYYNEWSQSGNAETRERVFLRVGTLRDLVAELSSWVIAADQIRNVIEFNDNYEEEYENE